MARRGTTDLSGILLIDKPGGMTSHDVVSAVRRATGERRVGHAGTLDPMATGLLVVLVGPATRLAPFLIAADKTYEARVAFGTATDTDDADGAVVAESPVPARLAELAFAEASVCALVGPHAQIPPAYSAIKLEGQIAHHAARRGESLDLAPREIEVLSARVQGIDGTPPAWDIELTVSKGTYVRALARDLGVRLGTVAHLAALRRTRCGGLDVGDAIQLAALESAPDVSSLFAPATTALGLPVLEIDDEAAADVVHGRPLTAGPIGEGELVSLVHDSRLLAVSAVSGDALRSRVVVPGGVA